MTTEQGATPSLQVQDAELALAPVTETRVRELVNELARIQDRLTAEDRATGARPSPGSTRRRAELLRRQRDVIAQLRARPSEDCTPGRRRTPPDPQL